MDDSQIPRNQNQSLDGLSHKWPILFAVAAGMFLTVGEQTAIVIALPAIAEDFSVNIPTVQWITLGYVLSTAAMFMPVGRFSDIFGRPKIYILSIFVFIIGSGIGALAPTYWILVGSKIIQGMATAGVQANAMAIITDAFPRTERGRAIGLYTTTVGIGASAGPFFGGILVDTLGWRSILVTTIPIGIIAIAAALAGLKRQSYPTKEKSKLGRFDWIGASVSSGALVSLLLGLSNAYRFGWGSVPIVISLVVAGGLGMFFFWWELHSIHPMLNLTFFKSSSFSIGIMTRFLLFLSNSPRVILMPFYLIKILGYSPYIAGLIMVAHSVSMAVSGAISGRLSDRLGTRWLMLVGIALAVVGMFTFVALDNQSSPVHVVIGLMLSGIGMGTFYSPNTSDILGSQSRLSYGIIAAVLNLTRTTGNIMGIAISTTVVSGIMTSAGYEPMLAGGGDSLATGLKSTFILGVNNTFFVSGSLLLMALVLCFMQGKPNKMLQV